MVDWSALDTELVPVSAIELRLHDMSPEHLHKRFADREPVELYEHGRGHFIVHDGRHRIISAWLAGRRVIPARVLR